MEDEGDYQEEVETPSETVGSNPRKRKQMDTRSDVWVHYNKIKDENGNLIKGQCKYCSKELSANTSKNGTSSLRNHLKTCKSYNVEGRQAKLAFQTNKDSGNTSLSTWTFNKDLARGKYIKMIIVDELPFKFGENARFREFMATVQPMFQEK
ncbi:putative Zinc finger, BED-type [Heracleum sosnowskyi]|uniref:Zinc finger, BED-type n=1 Tax=Heracleum sosnowskyi TaxID=360622 RepID=A0AAD8HGA5_9APIA|nr:putative Zinc finger, BED-type [Heracleum sosnowskyi]